MSAHQVWAGRRVPHSLGHGRQLLTVAKMSEKDKTIKNSKEIFPLFNSLNEVKMNIKMKLIVVQLI